MSTAVNNLSQDLNLNRSNKLKESYLCIKINDKSKQVCSKNISFNGDNITWLSNKS